MITQSKLKSGTLTIGGVSFACQATNVQIVPDHNESGDAVETLCGDSLSPDTTRSDTLRITAIQDFDNPSGFSAYSWDNDLETVAFSWKPSATSPTYSGQVTVRALTIGGAVNARLTAEAEWGIVGDVVRS